MKFSADRERADTVFAVDAAGGSSFGNLLLSSFQSFSSGKRLDID